MSSPLHIDPGMHTWIGGIQFNRSIDIIFIVDNSCLARWNVLVEMPVCLELNHTEIPIGSSIFPHTEHDAFEIILVGKVMTVIIISRMEQSIPDKVMGICLHQGVIDISGERPFFFVNWRELIYSFSQVIPIVCSDIVSIIINTGDIVPKPGTANILDDHW